MNDAERHARLTELFAELIAINSDARQQRLDAIDDPDLKDAARALMNAHAAADAAGAFLEHEPPRETATFGRYRILRLIGRGGMGDVYEAEQDSPRRRVALKLVRSTLSAPQIEKRLRLEAQIQSRLTHPGIATVHDAGVVVEGGVPTAFLAMELIDGEDLLTHARERRLDTRERVELLVAIAEAVAHAHERGVVHRDLKPANILVDREGRPRLLDFGIARALERRPEDGTALTSTGQVLGTVPYMSPEQFVESASVGRASDVYSLGVLGFELVSGRLPIDVRGLSLPEAVRVVEQREPSLLSSVIPGADRELEVIFAKALEKDAVRRYATAGELADDLRRWLRLEPVLARPASLGYVIGKLARRHRALVTAAAVAFVALALAALIATSEAMRARRAQREAEASRARATAMAYAASISAAAASLGAHDGNTAARHLRAAPDELRGWEWRHLSSRLDDSILHRELPAGWIPEQVRCGDGVIDVFARREPDGVPFILRWDRATDTWLPPAEARMDAAPRAWLPGFHVVHELAAREGSYATRDPLTRAPGPTFAPCRVSDARTELIALSIDADLFVQSQEHGRAPLTCNVVTETEVAGERPLAVRGVRRRLLTRRWDGAQDLVSVRDPDTLETRARLAAKSGLLDLALDEPRDRAVSMLGSGRLVAWSLADGSMTSSVAVDRTSSACRLAVTPDGVVAFSSGDNIEIRSPDLATRLGILVGHASPVIDLDVSRGERAVSPGDRVITSVAADGIRQWSLDAADPWSLTGHGTFVYEVEFDPSGEVLFTGGWDGALRAWSVRSGREIGVLRFGDPPDFHVPQAIIPSTDGERLFIALRDGHAGILSLVTGEWLAARDLVDHEPRGGAFQRDGSLLYLHGSDDGRGDGIDVLDGATLQRVRRLPEILAPACLLSDGRVAGSLRDGCVVIASARDGAVVQRFGPGLEGAMAALPGGTRLVTAAVGAPLSIWDVATGERLVAGDVVPDTSLLSIALSPDGTRLAVGTREGFVRVYETATATESLALRPHSAYVYALAWSPDGETLASASGDGTVRLHGTRRTSELLAARAEQESALEARVEAALRRAAEGLDALLEAPR